ncbi:O-antigen ligase [Fusobacterium sp. PH5-7]|nr:O-antigen ligase [Fusobacterium sp. PH5-7]
MLKKVFEKKSKIMSILSIIFIFFILRKGNERYTVDVIFIVTTLLFTFLDKKYNKISKGLLISIIGYIFFLSLSFIRTEYMSINSEVFFKIIIHNYILFTCLSQLELEEKYYKYFIVFFMLFSFIVTIKGIEEWSLHDFSPNYRLKSRYGPTVFTVEVAIYILISFIYLIYSKTKKEKLLSIITFIISFFILVGTNSRITLLTIPFLLIVIIGIKYRKKMKLSYFIIIIIILLSFLKTPYINKYLYRVKRLSSIENIMKETRIRIWNKGILDFKKNNYKALGFYHYNNVEMGAIPWEKNVHLHNNLLEILVTQGMLSLIFYITFNIFLFLEMIKKLKKTNIESQKIMLYIAISILSFLNLSGLTDSNIYFAKVNQLSFFIFALALCNVKIEDKKEIK